MPNEVAFVRNFISRLFKLSGLSASRKLLFLLAFLVKQAACHGKSNQISQLPSDLACYNFHVTG